MEGGKKGSKKGMGGLPPGDPQRFMEAYQGFMSQLSVFRNVPMVPVISTTAGTAAATTTTTTSSSSSVASSSSSASVPASNAAAGMLHPAFPAAVSPTSAEDLQRAALMHYYGMLPMAMGVNPFLFNSYWPSASMNLQKLAKEKGTDEKPTTKKDKESKQRDKKRVSDRGPVVKNWPSSAAAAAAKADAGLSQSVKSSQKSTSVTIPSTSLLTEVEKTVASAHNKLTSNFSPTGSSTSSLLPPYEGLPKATDVRRSSTGLPIQSMLKSPVDKQLSSAASTSSKASEGGDDDVILDLSSNKKRPADSTSSPIDEPKPQSDLSSNASRSPALSPTGPLLSPSSTGSVVAKKGLKTKRRGFSLEQAVQKLKEKTGEKVSSTSTTGESLSIFSNLPVKDSVAPSSKSQSESELEIPAKKANQSAGSYPGQSCDPDSTHSDVAPETVPKSSNTSERLESLLDEIRKTKEKPKSGLLENLNQLIETTVEKSYTGESGAKTDISVSSSVDQNDSSATSGNLSIPSESSHLESPIKEKETESAEVSKNQVKSKKSPEKPTTSQKGKKVKEFKFDALIEKIKENSAKEASTVDDDAESIEDDKPLSQIFSDTKTTEPIAIETKPVDVADSKPTKKKGRKTPKAKTVVQEVEAPTELPSAPVSDKSEKADTLTTEAVEPIAEGPAVTSEHAPLVVEEKATVPESTETELPEEPVQTPTPKGSPTKRRRRSPQKRPPAKRKKQVQAEVVQETAIVEAQPDDVPVETESKPTEVLEKVAEKEESLNPEPVTVTNEVAPAVEAEEVSQEQPPEESETKEKADETTETSQEESKDDQDEETDAQKEARLLEALYKETDERVLRKRPGRPCVFPRGYVPPREKSRTPRQPKKKALKTEEMVESIEPPQTILKSDIASEAPALDSTPIRTPSPKKSPKRKKGKGKGKKKKSSAIGNAELDFVEETENKIVGTILPLDNTEVKQEIKDEISKFCERSSIDKDPEELVNDTVVAPVVAPMLDKVPESELTETEPPVTAEPDPAERLSLIEGDSEKPKKKARVKKGTKKNAKNNVPNALDEISDSVINEISGSTGPETTEPVINGEAVIQNNVKSSPKRKGKNKASKTSQETDVFQESVLSSQEMHNTSLAVNEVQQEVDVNASVVSEEPEPQSVVEKGKKKKGKKKAAKNTEVSELPVDENTQVVAEDVTPELPPTKKGKGAKKGKGKKNQTKVAVSEEVVEPVLEPQTLPPAPAPKKGGKKKKAKEAVKDPVKDSDDLPTESVESITSSGLDLISGSAADVVQDILNDTEADANAQHENTSSVTLQSPPVKGKRKPKGGNQKGPKKNNKKTSKLPAITGSDTDDDEPLSIMKAKISDQTKASEIDAKIYPVPKISPVPKSTEKEISTESKDTPKGENSENSASDNMADIAVSSFADNSILTNLQQSTEFLHKALSSGQEPDKKSKFANRSPKTPKKTFGKKTGGDNVPGSNIMASIYDFDEEENETEAEPCLKIWRTPKKLTSPTAKQPPAYLQGLDTKRPEGASPTSDSKTPPILPPFEPPQLELQSPTHDVESPQLEKPEPSLVTPEEPPVSAPVANEPVSGTPTKSPINQGSFEKHLVQTPPRSASPLTGLPVTPTAKVHTPGTPSSYSHAAMTPSSFTQTDYEFEEDDDEEDVVEEELVDELVDEVEDEEKLLAKGLMRVPTPEPSLNTDNAVSIVMKENQNFSQDQGASIVTPSVLESSTVMEPPTVVEPPASALAPITSVAPTTTVHFSTNMPRLMTSACISSPVVADSPSRTPKQVVETTQGTPLNTPTKSCSSSDEYGFSPGLYSPYSSDTFSTPGHSSNLSTPSKLLSTPERVMMVTNAGSHNLDPSVINAAMGSVKDENDLVQRLKANLKEEVPQCACLGEVPFDERFEGPYYTHLGAAPDVPGIRTLMEERTGLTGVAIRIEKVFYTGKEGKSPQGCPVAKWIIRRSGPEEKVLVVVRPRKNHRCHTAVIIIGIVVWEGVPGQKADHLYNHLSRTLPSEGYETERRCGTNDQKTCACQGWQGDRAGASFSFGCSWSMYYNGCKFARSSYARKFRLKNEREEEILENELQDLATQLAPVYKQYAPDSYENMNHYEERAGHCRLGRQPGKPWGGVTACVDFCAHSHKDFHNMNNGCTMVVTLTKHRGFAKPDDEQLHVLPLCVMDMTDENGSMEGQRQKVLAGSLECLTKYPMRMRVRSTPLLSKRKRRLLAKHGADGLLPKKRGRKPVGAADGKGLGQDLITAARGRQRTLPGIKKIYRTPDGQVVAYRFTPDGKCVRVKMGGKKDGPQMSQLRLDSLPALPPTLPNGKLHPNMYPPELKQELAKAAQEEHERQEALNQKLAQQQHVQNQQQQQQQQHAAMLQQNAQNMQQQMQQQMHPQNFQQQQQRNQQQQLVPNNNQQQMVAPKQQFAQHHMPQQVASVQQHQQQRQQQMFSQAKMEPKQQQVDKPTLISSQPGTAVSSAAVPSPSMQMPASQPGRSPQSSQPSPRQQLQAQAAVPAAIAQPIADGATLASSMQSAAPSASQPEQPAQHASQTQSQQQQSTQMSQQSQQQQMYQSFNQQQQQQLMFNQQQAQQSQPQSAMQQQVPPHSQQSGQQQMHHIQQSQQQKQQPPTPIQQQSTHPQHPQTIHQQQTPNSQQFPQQQMPGQQMGQVQPSTSQGQQHIQHQQRQTHAQQQAGLYQQQQQSPHPQQQTQFSQQHFQKQQHLQQQGQQPPTSHSQQIPHPQQRQIQPDPQNPASQFWPQHAAKQTDQPQPNSGTQTPGYPMPPHGTQMVQQGSGPQGRGGPPFGGPGVPPFPPGHPGVQEKSGHTSNVTMELNGWFAKWSARMEPEQMEGKEIGVDGLPKPLPPGKSILEELVDDLLPPPPYPAAEKVPGMPSNMGERWPQQPTQWRPGQPMPRGEFPASASESMAGPSQAPHLGHHPGMEQGGRPFGQQHPHLQQPEAGPLAGGRLPPFQQNVQSGPFGAQSMPGAGEQAWQSWQQREERWPGQQQQQPWPHQRGPQQQPWQSGWPGQQQKWPGQGEKGGHEAGMMGHQWQGGYGYNQQQQHHQRPHHPSAVHPGHPQDPQQMSHPQMHPGPQHRPYSGSHQPGQHRYPGASQAQHWNQHQQSQQHHWSGKDFEEPTQQWMQQHHMQQRQYQQQQQQQYPGGNQQASWSAMQQQQQQQRAMGDWNQAPSIDINMRPPSVSGGHWQQHANAALLSPGGHSSHSAQSPFPGPHATSRPGSRCSSIGPSNTPQPLEQAHQAPFVGRQYPQQSQQVPQKPQVQHSQMQQQGQVPGHPGQMTPGHNNQMVPGQIHPGQAAQQSPMQQPSQPNQVMGQDAQLHMQNASQPRTPVSQMGEQSTPHSQMSKAAADAVAQATRDPLNILGDSNTTSVADTRFLQRQLQMASNSDFPGSVNQFSQNQQQSSAPNQNQAQHSMTSESKTTLAQTQIPSTQTSTQNQFLTNTSPAQSGQMVELRPEQVSSILGHQPECSSAETVVSPPSKLESVLAGEGMLKEAIGQPSGQDGQAVKVSVPMQQSGGQQAQPSVAQMLAQVSEAKPAAVAGSALLAQRFPGPAPGGQMPQHPPGQGPQGAQFPPGVRPPGPMQQGQMPHAPGMRPVRPMVPGQMSQGQLPSGPVQPGHQLPPFPMQTAQEEKPPQPKEVMTDCAELFSDPDIGGVAIALTHGAILFEVAKRELHATTAMKNPNRYEPTRIALVFYQHKNLNLPNHGAEEYEKRAEVWKQRRQEKLGIFEKPNVPLEQSDQLDIKRRWPWDLEEYPDIRLKYAKTPEVQEQWPAALNMNVTSTTGTVSTKWILPRPAIVGPYQRWT